MPLSKEDFELLECKFVTRAECDGDMDNVNKKLANDSTRLALISKQLNDITSGIYKLVWIVLTAVVTTFIAAISNIILR